MQQLHTMKLDERNSKLAPIASGLFTYAGCWDEHMLHR